MTGTAPEDLATVGTPAGAEGTDAMPVADVPDPVPGDQLPVAGEPDGRARAWRGPSVKRWILFAAIAIGVIVLDQLSKTWIAANIEFGQGMPVLGEWVNFVHWRNSGALFGLLPQSAVAFAVVSLGVIALIVVYHQKAGRGIVTTIALALLLGGAIGNLVDRVRWGYVLDWIDMGFPGGWRFFTYNVADAAITVAITCLIVMAIFPKVGDWGADD